VDDIEFKGPFSAIRYSCGRPRGEFRRVIGLLSRSGDDSVKCLSFGEARECYSGFAVHPHLGRSRYGLGHRREGNRRAFKHDCRNQTRRRTINSCR